MKIKSNKYLKGPFKSKPPLPNLHHTHRHHSPTSDPSKSRPSQELRSTC